MENVKRIPLTMQDLQLITQPLIQRALGNQAEAFLENFVKNVLARNGITTDQPAVLSAEQACIIVQVAGEQQPATEKVQ